MAPPQAGQPNPTRVPSAAWGQGMLWAKQSTHRTRQPGPLLQSHRHGPGFCQGRCGLWADAPRLPGERANSPTQEHPQPGRGSPGRDLPADGDLIGHWLAGVYGWCRRRLTRTLVPCRRKVRIRSVAPPLGRHYIQFGGGFGQSRLTLRVSVCDGHRHIDARRVRSDGAVG